MIMSKLQKIGLKTVSGIGILIFLFLTVHSWCTTYRMYTDNEDLVVAGDSLLKHILVLAAGLIVVGVISKISDYLSDRVIHGIAIGLSVLVTGIIIIIVQNAHAYAISTDQLHVYLGAEEMAFDKLVEIRPGEYFGFFPYQLYLSSLYAVMFRIFGKSSFEMVQNLHAVCVGLTFYFGFCITGELFCGKKAKCLYLPIALAFIPLHLYSLFIYGEVLSAFGSMAGIYFWIKANKKENGKGKLFGYFALTGLFMTVAYFARLSVIIVCIAMFIIQLLIFFKNRKLLPVILAAAVLALPVAGQKMVLTSIEWQTGVKFDHTVPIELRLAMGLQGDVANGQAPGAYNSYPIATFSENQYDREISIQEGNQYIQERLAEWIQNPGDALLFFKTKLLNQWNEPSYSAFTVTRFMDEPKEWISSMYYGRVNEMLYALLNQYQAVFYLAVFIYMVMLFRGSNEIAYLPGLVAIGGFLFSAIWEAKSRYILPYIVILIPCFAGGMVIFYDKLAGLWKKYQPLKYIKTKG